MPCLHCAWCEVADRLVILVVVVVTLTLTLTVLRVSLGFLTTRPEVGTHQLIWLLLFTSSTFAIADAVQEALPIILATLRTVNVRKLPVAVLLTENHPQIAMSAAARWWSAACVLVVGVTSVELSARDVDDCTDVFTTRSIASQYVYFIDDQQAPRTTCNPLHLPV